MELMSDLRPGLEALSAGDAPFCGRPTRDSAVNTDPDWEDQIQTALETGSKLSQDFNVLKLKQQQDELDFSKNRSEAQKKRDQAVRQHQALLEKLESVRVKLQLNNSKNTRKNFLSKIQEVTSEKSHAQEEHDRLGEELAEAELRLAALEQEQEEERRQWEDDLAELRRQTERAQKEAQDAEAKAQRDMKTALERQRDTGDEMVLAWFTQVGVYLSGLRAELPHRYRQEKAQWERREAAVKRSQVELQTQISDLLLQLDRHELENLPPIHLPALPQVPMAELYFHRIMQMTPRPPALPPVMVPPPILLNPRPALLPTPLRHAHLPLRHPPFPRQHYPLPMIPAHPFLPVTSLPVHSPSPQTHTPPPQAHTPPPQIQTPPLPQQAPPTINTPANPADHEAPPSLSPAPAGVTGAPAGVTGAPAGVTGAPAGAVGKLDKVLEKLGAQFPRCSRAQLTRFLQQVKSERGTLAGLSMEEVVEQIRLKVETASAQPRPAPLTAPGAPGPVPQKPCLVCQKPVDASAKLELQCSHTVHTDCIQVWLQSSKSNSCPFCPNK